MKQRLNQIIVICGRKGAGKTTTGKALATKNGKKVLVVDTFDHPSYRDHAEIQAHQLKRWKSGNARIYRGDSYENLQTISKHVYNAVLILEDAAKYLDPNIGKTIKPIFVDSKQHNIDMIIMFHAVKEIPPYLHSFIDRIVIHKTNETIKRTASKFANEEQILSVHERVMKHPKPHYCEVIKINE